MGLFYFFIENLIKLLINPPDDVFVNETYLKGQDMEATEIAGQARTIRGHLEAAKDRNAPRWFIHKLRMALWLRIEQMNALTSKVACIGLVGLVLAVSGCATVRSAGGVFRGIGQDIENGTDATVRGVQNYSDSYNQRYDQPRMVN